MKSVSQQIAENLRLLHEDGEAIEIRTLVTGKRQSFVRYFDNIAEAAEYAANQDIPGRNVYQTFNLLPGDLLYRDGGEGTKDHEVARYRWMMVDVDPKRLAGLSATKKEKETARDTIRTIAAWLKKKGWPDPHAFDSGNGYHLFYRIDLPNDAESAELVKGALEGLTFRFDTEEAGIDTGVFNASRITTVYGSMKRKGKDGEERPHRRSKLLTKGGDGIVTADQLREIAPPEPEDPRANGRGRHRIRPTESFDVQAWLEEHGVPVKRSGPYQGGRRWILEECPWQGHADDAMYVIQFPSGGISAGCSHNSCPGGRGNNAWHEVRAFFQPGWEPYEERTNGHRSKGTSSAADTANTANTANEFEDLKDLPEPTKFPLSALTTTIRQFTREAAASVGCPVDYVGVSVLAALSAAIGDTRRLVIKRDWTEGAALYAMIVGGPASKKSPAMSLALRPVRERQMALKNEYDRQKEEYQVRLENWNKEDNPDDDKPRKPTMGRTYVDDTTVERLADILNQNPRGVLVTKDELSGWLGGMNQYKQGGKGGDRQFWLSAHTNQPVAVDRKSADEPVIIPHPFVSVLGGIQPEVLGDFGKDRGDGLIDRFIAAYPEPHLSRWTDDEVSEKTSANYTALLQRLYRLEHAWHDGDTFSSRVHMTDEAKALFVEQYDALHEELESPGFPQRLRPAWGKLEAYLARFALILAMARVAELEIMGRGPTEQVTREDMEGAVELLAYFKNHARRVYTGLYGDNAADNLAADLRDFLVSCGGQWEGSASELFEAFESEHKPDRDKDLGKAVRAIAKRSPLLWLEDLPRKTALRRFRLTLKNVGSVGSVGSDGAPEDEDVEAEVTI